MHPDKALRKKQQWNLHFQHIDPPSSFQARHINYSDDANINICIHYSSFRMQREGSKEKHTVSESPSKAPCFFLQYLQWLTSFRPTSPHQRSKPPTYHECYRSSFSCCQKQNACLTSCFLTNKILIKNGWNIEILRYLPSLSPAERFYFLTAQVKDVTCDGTQPTGRTHLQHPCRYQPASFNSNQYYLTRKWASWSTRKCSPARLRAVWLWNTWYPTISWGLETEV